jgi:hypothetical protein
MCTTIPVGSTSPLLTAPPSPLHWDATHSPVQAEGRDNPQRRVAELTLTHILTLTSTHILTPIHTLPLIHLQAGGWQS